MSATLDAQSLADIDGPATTVTTSPNNTSNIDGYLLHEKVMQLDVLIKAAHPVMPVMLKQIHDQLSKDPEQVTLLSEEEIGIIVSGLKRKMNTDITTTPAKKESVAKLKAKNLNEDMF